MNIYITTGTYDFLKKLKDKQSKETIFLMQNGQTALLLHETSGKTVFSSPRRYEVVDAKGTIQEKGFVVMNNIPVTDEGRPILEYQLKNNIELIEKAPGLIAIRILRPKKSDTYILLTVWQKESDFLKWKHSKSFDLANPEQQKPSGNMFTAAPYITKYTLISEEK